MNKTLLLAALLAATALTACRNPVRATELPEEIRPSGLTFVDLVVGEGREVVDGSRVSVHYVGSFEDGERFDSSYDRGTPLSFTVGGGEVIRGWEEGMLGMRAGGHRVIQVPAELGFAAGSSLAGRALSLDVELLELE